MVTKNWDNILKAKNYSFVLADRLKYSCMHHILKTNSERKRLYKHRKTNWIKEEYLQMLKWILFHLTQCISLAKTHRIWLHAIQRDACAKTRASNHWCSINWSLFDHCLHCSRYDLKLKRAAKPSCLDSYWPICAEHMPRKIVVSSPLHRVHASHRSNYHQSHRRLWSHSHTYYTHPMHLWWKTIRKNVYIYSCAWLFVPAFDRVLCHARSISAHLIVSTSFSHKLHDENVVVVIVIAVCYYCYLKSLVTFSTFRA